MRRTSRLLVIFGIGLAVLTFVLIIALLPGNGGSVISPQATPTAPANLTVVTAIQDIPLGTVVTGDMLGSATLPSNAVSADTFRDKSQVIGQVARQNILTGAQVRAAQFALDQSIQQVQVPPGKRAMSVYVSDLTGVGRLIHIGDTVDVVLTFNSNLLKVLTLPQGATTPTHDDGFAPLTVKAPLLLQDLQVIGTLDQAPATSGSSSGASNNQAANASAAPSGPTADANAQKLIILAVTDAQAEALLFARTGGTIDLVLRSPADAGTTAATDGVILRTMFEKYGVLPPYVVKTFPIYVPNQP